MSHRSSPSDLARFCCFNFCFIMNFFLLEKKIKTHKCISINITTSNPQNIDYRIEFKKVFFCWVFLSYRPSSQAPERGAVATPASRRVTRGLTVPLKSDAAQVTGAPRAPLSSLPCCARRHRQSTSVASGRDCGRAARAGDVRRFRRVSLTLSAPPPPVALWVSPQLTMEFLLGNPFSTAVGQRIGEPLPSTVTP